MSEGGQTEVCNQKDRSAIWSEHPTVGVPAEYRRPRALPAKARGGALSAEADDPTGGPGRDTPAQVTPQSPGSRGRGMDARRVIVESQPIT